MKQPKKSGSGRKEIIHARIQSEEEIDVRESFGRMWEILGQQVSEEVWMIVTDDLGKADLILCPEARRARNKKIRASLQVHRGRRSC